MEVDVPSHYPYPYKIISRYAACHGAIDAAGSVGGDPRRWFQDPLSVHGTVFATETNVYRPTFGEGRDSVKQQLDYMEYLIEQEG